jgi:hypothetical protein
MNAMRTAGGVVLVAGLVALSLSSGVALVGCGGGRDAAANGSTGQPCYPNNTCDAGLACKRGTCVENPSGGTGTAGGQGGASTISVSGSGGAGGSGNTTATSSTSAAGGSGGAPSHGDQPPRFLSFGTDVTTITQGQTVTISAVLTDPDGIDDIIGGTLFDSSGATYGAFATSGEEGAYQLSVTWSQFTQVSPIEFAYGATGQRVLTAQFFDQEGHSAEKSTTITFTCNGIASCDGTCTDTTKTAAHCGTCGHACGDGSGCYDNKCGKLSACLPFADSCDEACAAKGKVCKDLCGNAVGQVWYHQACMDDGDSYDLEAIGGCGTPLANDGGASMKCCCF